MPKVAGKFVYVPNDTCLDYCAKIGDACYTVRKKDLCQRLTVFFSTSIEEGIFPDVSKNRGTHLTCLLLNYLLDCLHKCLVYDNHGFLDGDRFQCLMQPLVDQVRC